MSRLFRTSAPEPLIVEPHPMPTRCDRCGGELDSAGACAKQCSARRVVRMDVDTTSGGG